MWYTINLPCPLIQLTQACIHLQPWTSLCPSFVYTLNFFATSPTGFVHVFNCGPFPNMWTLLSSCVIGFPCVWMFECVYLLTETRDINQIFIPVFLSLFYLLLGDDVATSSLLIVAAITTAIIQLCKWNPSKKVNIPCWNEILISSALFMFTHTLVCVKHCILRTFPSSVKVHYWKESLVSLWNWAKFISAYCTQSTSQV